ncbi:MAG TPA: pyruvate kinase [Patescibacteria group bacterium]|nr:pyruvate kinase [Patescibacteria group bacterium]
MKKTKIVCTLGPASDKKKILKQLVENGMNVARLNFSHNTHAYHERVMKRVCSVATELNEPVAILQDLQGPRIRLGNLPEKGIMLKKGQERILTSGRETKEKIPVDYKEMPKDVKPGDRILIADGLIGLEVLKTNHNDIKVKVITGGRIFSHKGINLPDSDVSVPVLSEKDKKDLFFGVKNGVDFVALSFVRSAKDVYDLKYLIKKYTKELKTKEPPIKIVVKVERREAVDNIDEIIEATDGVMVARGDLGIELPAEDVPLMQKMIIDKCLQAAKPVIVATQMLDSMIKNPRPTRAEVSDVANAVIDHTDAVMLSGETAAGKYPVETVDTMRKIIKKTEDSAYDDLVVKDKIKHIVPTNEAISSVAKMLSGALKTKLILVATLSGYSAKVVSRYRPQLPVFAVCDTEKVRRQLSLTWGVRAFSLSTCESFEELLDRSIGYLKKVKQLKIEDKIIIIAGQPVGRSGNVNLVEIKTIE